MATEVTAPTPGTDPTPNADRTPANPVTPPAPAGAAAVAGTSGSSQWVTTAILIIALLFFIVPWLAAAVFGFSRPGQPVTFEPLASSFGDPKALEALRNTVLLTIATTLLMLVLLVPTIVYVNLKTPVAAKIAEFLSVLPLVVPAVAMVSGVSEFYRAIAPAFLISMWSLVPIYVVISLPLCYRAIDAGVKALDLKTLFAASSSLGATGPQTLVRVVLPNLRVAMLSAALLCITMVLGEFAIASLMLHYTFPVFIVEVSSTNPRGVAALAFVTIVITWALLWLISAISEKSSAKKGD